MHMLQVLLSCFMAILFIQSGLDKVINWKGEKSFYKSHFSNTFLKNSIDLLMPAITIMELASGFCSAVGIFMIIFLDDHRAGCWGMLFASITLLMLFFGQRVAKDYTGAATLVPYFLTAAFGMYLYLS